MSVNRENPLREALDSIEPAGGARERMLANIRNKAALKDAKELPENLPEKKPEIRRMTPLKRWVLPAAACIAAAIIGASFLPGLMNRRGNPIDVSTTDIGNPYAGVSGADEFERRLGIVMDIPEGTEEAEYHIIDGSIADACFATGGHWYDLRASRERGDISGLYGDVARTERLSSDRDAVLTVIQSGDEVYTLITWTHGGVNYSLSNTDGAPEGEIIAVFESLPEVRKKK